MSGYTCLSVRSEAKRLTCTCCRVSLTSQGQSVQLLPHLWLQDACSQGMQHCSEALIVPQWCLTRDCWPWNLEGQPGAVCTRVCKRYSIYFHIQVCQACACLCQ